MNKVVVNVDCVILGGGVAGLWLLNRLRQEGYSALLFESGMLGGGQTHKAQGIIHGGMKYALQGLITKEAEALQEMPSRWRACLNGQGEINLSQVPILSTKQYLFSPQTFALKITGFLASKTLTSEVTALPKEEYPAFFQHPSFKGEVYALDEMVIDIPTLVRELVKANQDAVYKIEPLCSRELLFNENGELEEATVYMAGKSVTVKAQRFIFAAGSGNEVIVNRLNHPDIEMQRRPLHMVLVKVQNTEPLYAHCIGFSHRPRLTITSHRLTNGELVWYIGGSLAEDGISLDKNNQIEKTYRELSSLFPWIDFESAEYATCMVDRAEPKQKGLLKPESCFAKAIGNSIIAWPTKLAFAPKLADEIITLLKAVKLSPSFSDVRELRAWPMPPISTPIWEDAFCKSDV